MVLLGVFFFFKRNGDDLFLSREVVSPRQVTAGGPIASDTSNWNIMWRERGDDSRREEGRCSRFTLLT